MSLLFAMFVLTKAVELLRGGGLLRPDYGEAFLTGPQGTLQ